MENQEQGYIKKTITFLVPTQAGDNWLNKQDWDFEETRKGTFIINEKTHDTSEANKTLDPEPKVEDSVA